MHKIKDLKIGMTNVDVEAKVDFLGYTNKGTIGYGDSLYVQSYIKDDTGEIKMTFWDEDARTVKEGKMIRVTKGTVGEYRGELQLNLGKTGKLEFCKG